MHTINDYTQTSAYQSATDLFKEKIVKELQATQPQAKFKFEGHNLRFNNILTSSKLKSGFLQQHHKLEPEMIAIWDAVIAEVTPIVRIAKIDAILAYLEHLENSTPSTPSH